MGIGISPQGDITVNESAIKNTDAEIRDGVWSDSTKVEGANISHIYGDTSTILTNTSSILIDGDNVLANSTLIIQKTQNLQHRSFFKSNMQANITLDIAGTTDLALPGIEIPSGILPTNATFDAAYCAFKYGSRKDSSNANNAIDGDQYIQIKEEVSGNYTNAIKVPSGTLPIDLAHTDIMGGDILFGKIDVSSQVAMVNKSYSFQWTNCKVSGNNMIVSDIQSIVEIWWH
jgi:hypothetical protein